ncbi:MAG: hypothetical protein IJC71_05360, partial [Clostridia bacterium]|nr:hypothetical protein [Clostridia bacterium]
SSRERIRYARDFINKSSVKIIKYGLSKSFDGRSKPLPYRILDISSPVTHAAASNFQNKGYAAAVYFPALSRKLPENSSCPLKNPRKNAIIELKTFHPFHARKGAQYETGKNRSAALYHPQFYVQC